MPFGGWYQGENAVYLGLRMPKTASDTQEMGYD